MTPELIAGLVGIVFSLLQEFMPRFSAWYNELEDVYQRLLPVGVGLLVVYGAFGLGCAALIAAFWPCTGDGAWLAFKSFLAFLLANQGTYALFLKKDKPEIAAVVDE